jgi:hypothetical protein
VEDDGYMDLTGERTIGDERCRQRGVAIGEWSSASGVKKNDIVGG